MKKIIFIFITSTLLCIEAFAGVSVMPVQLFIVNPEKQKSTTLTLESVDENEKRIFEVKAFKWTQDERGENILEPDNNIMVNPKSFILQPNKKQTIRVGFIQPPSALLANKQEEAWRIIVDEIPPVIKESSVRFLVNLNLPLFLGKQDDLKLKFDLKDNKLIVQNNANSHLQILNLKIVDANKKEVFKSDTMSYLLAKKNQIYDLDNLKLTNSKNYYVQLNTDKNEKMVEMKLFD